MKWSEFAADAPELAVVGRARLADRVCYLATIKRGGSPRVHPVTPDMTSDGLYTFMFPSSPKSHDLRRDPRYALHASVEDPSGGVTEFLVSGRATVVDSPEERAAVAAASGTLSNPVDRYILFAVGVEHAMLTTYVERQPVRVRWDAPPA